jgi:hypothetical protein
MPISNISIALIYLAVEVDFWALTANSTQAWVMSDNRREDLRDEGSFLEVVFLNSIPFEEANGHGSLDEKVSYRDHRSVAHQLRDRMLSFTRAIRLLLHRKSRSTETQSGLARLLQIGSARLIL